jgi:hypothetical protein
MTPHERKLMYFKTAFAAIAAAAALAGAATTLPAQAATPSCGVSCINLYNRVIGHSFILDAQGGGFGVAGQPLILWQRSNSGYAEDFTVSDEGTVKDFAFAGLMSPVMLLHYAKDPAFELEYAPYGADTGLCMGLAATPVPGEQVTLQPCGISAKTVWVLDAKPTTPSDFFAGLNGAGTNFSHPFVLTYPQGSYPTDSPRPVLQVQELSSFSTGQYSDSQLWWGKLGIEP